MTDLLLSVHSAWIFTSWSLGEQLLAVRNGVTPEPDALLRIQHAGLGDQTLHSAHATVHHVHGDFAHL